MKIHFEKPGFSSENIFMTGGEKPGFFYKRLIRVQAIVRLTL
ncbi:Uncharacterized protein dnm_041650 [Desulfonema magnum]|uniref:Uncharacterized protein n=1 Tax=Desulfonema magnum TaxID=45655 RepID=A0A975GNT8_9BACT|nr:Uncharacterized protein dnm_041650 [Desulfonema magnum]